MGIQTFDTANVYSSGRSEIILGKAIKKFNFPREEIVVMSKVRLHIRGYVRCSVFYDSATLGLRENTW